MFWANDSFIQKRGEEAMHFRKSSAETETQTSERACDKHFWDWFDNLEKSLGSSGKKIKVKTRL